MDGKPEPIDGAPLRSDDSQVFGAEHVVPRHLGGIDRDGEQACALLGRQQSAAGHSGLRLVAGGRS